MVELLFELVGTRMMPVLPSPLRAPDGTRFFTLADAPTRSGLPAEELEAEWLAYLADAPEILNKPRANGIPPARLQSLRDVRFPHLTEELWRFLISDCESRGLDPSLVWANPKFDDATGKQDLDIITTIAAFRQIAERTGERKGESAPQWCGPDGHWFNVWPEVNTPPHAARVFVTRAGHGEPYEGVAYWKFHAQYRPGEDGLPVLNEIWQKGDCHMLGKCAAALAYRAGWPDKLGKLYTSDEIPIAPRRKVEATRMQPIAAALPAPTAAGESPMLPVSDDPKLAWNLVDDSTPDSADSLLRELLNVCDSAKDARTLIERFKKNLPKLASSHFRAFCAVVLRCVRENPAAYGLTV